MKPLNPTPPLQHRFAAAGAQRPSLEGRLLRAGLVERMFGDRTEPVSLGRFELERVLGEGGMGKVYLARDPKLARPVAIKVLHPGAEQERLAKEARAMARINHPHVVQVFDVGTTPGGDLFIAMEWIPGTTLQTWISEPHDLDTTLDVLLGAGRGLAAAHDAGVLHRDFKPANVLLSNDHHAKVTDFGLAGTQRNDVGDRGPITIDEGTTVTGTVLGTPAYMAPEQRAAERIDASADQFSFCLVVIEALWNVRLKLDEGPEHFEMQLDRVQAKLSTAKERTRFVAIRRGLSWDRADRWPRLELLLDAIGQSHSRKRWRPWLAAPLLVAGLGLAVAGFDRGSDVTAESTQLTPITISARIDLAEDLVIDGSFDAASRELEASFDAATATGSSIHAARAAAELIFVDGYLRALPERGRQWARHAAAALARLEPQPDIESRMERHVGVLDQQAGSPATALEHFNTALQLATRVHGEDHPRVAAIWGNLGSNAYATDDLVLSQHYYGRALSILESTPSPQPVWLAMALDDLGSTELGLGEITSAEQRFRKALELRKHLRPGHPHQSISWRLLGWAALETGRLEDAQLNYEQAVAAAKVAYGSDHPSVAVLVADLAEVHLEARDFDRAAELFSQALVTNDATVGREHRESRRAKRGAELARSKRQRPQSVEAISDNRAASSSVGK